MLGDLGKLIVAKGFKKLPKVQKIARSGHTGPMGGGRTEGGDAFIWFIHNILISPSVANPKERLTQVTI